MAVVENENERPSLNRQFPSPSTVERLKVRPLPPPEPGQQVAPLPVPPQQPPIREMPSTKPLPDFDSNKQGEQVEPKLQSKSQPAKQRAAVKNVKKRNMRRGLPRKSEDYKGELNEAGPRSSGTPANPNSPSKTPKSTPSPKYSNGTSDRATAYIYDSLGSTAKKTFKLDEKYKQICRCGEKLVWTKAQDCYPMARVTGSMCGPKAKSESTSRVVSCDICKKSMKKTNFVYHCVRLSDLHPTGYDVCGPCIIERSEKKQLIKEQLKNNPDLQFCRTRGQLLELALRQDTLEVDVTGIVIKRPPSSGRFSSKKCYYTVKVDTGAYAWTIPCRYSKFLGLHENLQKMERCVCIGFGRKLPKFPKKPFVSLRKTKKKKTEQMTAFRAYIEALLQNKDTRNDPHLYLFLCSKPGIVVRKNTIDDILGTHDSSKGMVYHAYQKTTYL